jgi:hypothetical protein
MHSSAQRKSGPEQKSSEWGHDLRIRPLGSSIVQRLQGIWAVPGHSARYPGVRHSSGEKSPVKWRGGGGGGWQQGMALEEGSHGTERVTGQLTS